MNSYARTTSSNEAAQPQTRFIPSGSINLDIALGIGGFARGSIVEISGFQASGKTALCQHVVAEAQKQGGLCAWIDTDCTFSPEFAAVCGIQVPSLIYCQPDSSEQALMTLEMLARSGAFQAIVLDSMQTLISTIELQGALPSIGEKLNQDMLSACLRRISPFIHRNGILILFTSYPDTRMSFVYHQLSTRLSRLALKFYAAQRLRLKQIEPIKRGKRHLGVKIRANIIKNKFAPCLYTTDFDIMYDQGINKPAEVFSLGVSLELIQASSNGFLFRETFLGKTDRQAISFIKQHSTVSEAIELEIRRKLVPQF
jgi:recombination protein RecA